MKQNLSIIILMSLLFFVGCNKNDIDPVTSWNEADIVEFTTEIATRGTPINSNAELVVGNTIGVFCSYTGGDDWSASAPLGKMFNEKLTLNNDKTQWNYEQGSEVKWDLTSIADKYTFFAYMPHAIGIYDQSNAAGNGIVVNGNKGDNGVPTLTYTVPMARVASHPDLMFAVPKKNNRYTNRAVQLDMQHALSQITFAARTDGSKVEAIRITDITLKDIVYEGTANIDAGEIVWTLPSDKSGDVSVHKTPLGGDNPSSLIDHTLDNTTTNTKRISSDNGALFMIPQKISGKKIHVLLETIGSSNNTLEFTKILNSPEPDGTWKPGKAYQYTIVYTGQGALSYSINCTIIDWVDKNINEALPATFLNVSERKVTVKAGAQINIYCKTDYKGAITTEGSPILGSIGINGKTISYTAGTTLGKENITIAAGKLKCVVEITVN